MDKRKLLHQIIKSLDEENPDDSEVIEFLHTYQFVKIHPETPVQDGSLVLLENQGNQNWYFLLPIEGGKFLSLDGNAIMTITPFSKMGMQMIDKKIGESFEVVGKSSIQQFKIVEHH